MIAEFEGIDDSALAALTAICTDMRTRRENRDLTQVELAHELGISVSALRNWERHREFPRMPKFLHWVHRFDARLGIVDQTGTEVFPAAQVLHETQPAWEEREIRRLADTLRGLRAQCGLEQQELAAMLPWNRHQFNRLERGNVTPLPAGLCQWAYALDCRVVLVEL